MKKDKGNVSNEIKIFLADNDEKDDLFFKETLHQLPLTTQLRSVYDDDELMLLLKSFWSGKQADTNPFPNIIFLDLNMLPKSELKGLAEIKAINTLKNNPIAIISSALDTETVAMLYDSKANYNIQKPGNFLILKKSKFSDDWPNMHS
ncbi:response regulator [Winogradskyella wichelsiae]|uniref:response regulator n=1 Tax=Winogradskyella wichelsiae TaxID=2697007 RepID=UPI003EF74078